MNRAFLSYIICGLFLLSACQERFRITPGDSVSNTTPDTSLSGISGYVYSYAGAGTAGDSGEAGLKENAELNEPLCVHVADQDTLYFCDTVSGKVKVIPRKDMTLFGISMLANHVYTVAGGGFNPIDNTGNDPLDVSFFQANDIRTDAAGNLFFAVPMGPAAVYMIPAASGTYFGISMLANKIYRVAGNGGSTADGEDPLDASFNWSNGIELDADGNLLIADNNNSFIRMVPRQAGTYFGVSMLADKIYTIVGNGSDSYAGDGGPATAAGINHPFGLRIDSAGNLIFADSGNNVVRMVPKVTGTYFGTAMTANNIYTIAGTGGPVGDTGEGGLATLATFHWLHQITLAHNGDLIISDANNNKIKYVPRISGTYFGISMTANNVYTIAGNGNASDSGDEGVATNAEFNMNYGIDVDSDGNLLIADRYNNRIRYIPK